jgi:RNA polymerase sigma-70 factor (family 1)
MEDHITHSEIPKGDHLDGDVKASGAVDNSGTALQEFEQLFHQYYSYLCSTADAILHDSPAAEDIVQEFYISHWNKQNHTLLPSAFRAYAKRAVTNDCLDLLRKQSVIEKKSSNLENSESHNPETEADEIELSQTRQQKILDLVEQLPESRKQILLLHAVEKLSYAKIAKKQGVSINTVRTQLSRAYKSLRSQAALILLYFLRK